MLEGRNYFGKVVIGACCWKMSLIYSLFVAFLASCLLCYGQALLKASIICVLTHYRPRTGDVIERGLKSLKPWAKQSLIFLSHKLFLFFFFSQWSKYWLIQPVGAYVVPISRLAETEDSLSLWLGMSLDTRLIGYLKKQINKYVLQMRTNNSKNLTRNKSRKLNKQRIITKNTTF